MLRKMQEGKTTVDRLRAIQRNNQMENVSAKVVHRIGLRTEEAFTLLNEFSGNQSRSLEDSDILHFLSIANKALSSNFRYKFVEEDNTSFNLSNQDNEN